MKKRSSLLLVAGVVLGLVLGSFGTAVAGPVLTKAKVKAIAAKVVKKKASTLSVAHASTADSATNLNGQPASAYQTPSRTFVLPQQPASTARTYPLAGIAPGTYLVSYSLFLKAAAAFTSECYLTTPSSIVQVASSYGANFSTFNTNSASALMVVGTATPQLQCTGGAAWQIHDASGYDSRITFTKVDAATAGTTSGRAESGRASATGPAA